MKYSGRLSESLRRFGGKAKDLLKYHIVDSTALLVVVHPYFTPFELGLLDMSCESSLKTRLMASLVTYAGMGVLISKGRDLSRKIFKIGDWSKERTQFIHDSVYLAVFSAVTGPVPYLLSGANSWKEIAGASALSTAFGFFSGGPVGYAVDIFRDLFGLKECKRKSYPEYVRRQKPRIKKMLAAGLIAASVGLVGLIYQVMPDKRPVENPGIVNPIPKQTIRNQTNLLESIVRE